MGVAAWLRALAVYAVATAVLVVAFSAGRRWGVVAVALLLLAFLAVRVMVPRAAHRAFVTGRHRRSQRLYRALGWVRISDHARACITVSRAACLVAMGEYDDAEGLLSSVREDQCPESARAASLNNRAYGLVHGKGDMGAALVAAREAVELRPKVPGFHHTLGLVHLERDRRRPNGCGPSAWLDDQRRLHGRRHVR